ncbi:VanZ family protein [Streptococcus oralis subsp. tigurinus]|uniref:VanZ family protein n=1 Tax=Streptococcus oralis TaxID=1303 RepID=UPI002000AEE8|nr:VanZ family protein [Streptococcus oralis]
MIRKRELILRLGVAIYSLCIVCFCFTPQPQLPTGVETPGIQTFGRLVFLLTPLNSLWNLCEVTSLGQVIWIFLQNILNVFLLFPLVFQLIYLCPNLRQTKKIILLSFLLSLGIECTQLVLDFLFDFNRVFEIDDLWTNTLGGYLAWVLYRKLNVTKLTKELE